MDLSPVAILSAKMPASGHIRSFSVKKEKNQLNDNVYYIHPQSFISFRA